MNEEILKRLDTLAAKLGVASATLFSWAQKQVMVDAFVAWLWCVILAALTYASWWLFNRLNKNNDDWAGGALASLLLCGVVSMIVFGCAVDYTASAIVNPEWAAFNKIADMVKGAK